MFDLEIGSMSLAMLGSSNSQDSCEIIFHNQIFLSILMKTIYKIISYRFSDFQVKILFAVVFGDEGVSS